MKSRKYETKALQLLRLFRKGETVEGADLQSLTKMLGLVDALEENKAYRQGAIMLLFHDSLDGQVHMQIVTEVYGPDGKPEMMDPQEVRHFLYEAMGMIGREDGK